MPSTRQKTDAPLLREFGQRVRAHRKKMGVSQEALGQVAGLDRTYIGGIERGERNISLSNVVRLARALDVDPGTLLQRLT